MLIHTGPYIESIDVDFSINVLMHFLGNYYIDIWYFLIFFDNYYI